MLAVEISAPAAVSRAAPPSWRKPTWQLLTANAVRSSYISNMSCHEAAECRLCAKQQLHGAHVNLVCCHSLPRAGPAVLHISYLLYASKLPDHAQVSAHTVQLPSHGDTFTCNFMLGQIVRITPCLWVFPLKHSLVSHCLSCILVLIMAFERNGSRHRRTAAEHVEKPRIYEPQSVLKRFNPSRWPLDLFRKRSFYACHCHARHFMMSHRGCRVGRCLPRWWAVLWPELNVSVTSGRVCKQAVDMPVALAVGRLPR